MKLHVKICMQKFTCKNLHIQLDLAEFVVCHLFLVIFLQLFEHLAIAESLEEEIAGVASTVTAENLETAAVGSIATAESPGEEIVGVGSIATAENLEIASVIAESLGEEIAAVGSVHPLANVAEQRTTVPANLAASASKCFPTCVNPDHDQFTFIHLNF